MLLRPPPSKAQSLGTSIHNALEAYYKHGTESEDARVIETLKKLPPRGDDISCEGQINIPIDDHREINGRGDLLILNPEHPVIIDHKTSKDVNRWAKTSYELENDVQVNIYAKHALMTYPTASVATVTHNTIATTGAPYSLQTSATLTRNHVENNYHGFLKIIDDMTSVWGYGHVSETKPNGRDNGECNAFGGCPHKEYCDVVMFTKRKEQPMNEELKAKIAAIAKDTRAKRTGPEQPEEQPVEVIPAAPVQSTGQVELAPTNAKLAPEETAGPILLINCSPILGVNAVPLEIWVASILDRIEEEYHLNWQLIDYGKGKGLLEQAVNDCTEFPEALIIDGGSSLGKACLPALMRKNPNAILRGW